MKIGVLGAGAMGGIVSIGLHRAGQDVTIIDPWKAHVDAIRTSGFHMTGYYGGEPVDWTGVMPAIHVDEMDQLKGPLDLVFLCVKGYNTPAVRRADRTLPDPRSHGRVSPEWNERAYHRQSHRTRTYHRVRDPHGRPDLGAGAYSPYLGRRHLRLS